MEIDIQDNKSSVPNRRMGGTFLEMQDSSQTDKHVVSIKERVGGKITPCLLETLE